jgi:hypothetical protein
MRRERMVPLHIRAMTPAEAAEEEKVPGFPGWDVDWITGPSEHFDSYADAAKAARQQRGGMRGCISVAPAKGAQS